ncbi:hypothetical protein ACFVIZ_06465 [Streptomyces anulatus]|uniref:hypothetical protein n=1 Tax=Streptomyces anulatus TaxID=1892 RepID=UPI0036414039
MNDTIAFNRLAGLLGSMGEPTLYRGGALRTRGICHNGTANDSVAIRRGNNSNVVIWCHVCEGNADFLAAIGWTEADCYDEPLPQDERRQQWPTGDTWIPCRDHGKDKGGSGHKRTAQYIYRDENGRTVHGVTRCDHKCFAQWRPDNTTKSGRRWSRRRRDGPGRPRLRPRLAGGPGRRPGAPGPAHGGRRRRRTGPLTPAPGRPHHCQATGRPGSHPSRDRTTIMALQTSISIGDLKKKNAESQASRDAEKRGTPSNSQQKKGR